MKFIGIHDGHNASLSIMEDGNIIFAIQEERFTYEKNQGGLPKRSIQYLIENYGLSQDDEIGIVGNHVPTYDWSKKAVLNAYSNSTSRKNLFKHYLKNFDLIYNFYSKKMNRPRIDILSNTFKGHKFHFLDHHLCHASATYYGYGNYDEDVLIITADGDGDRRSGSIHIGTNGNLKELESLKTKDSLGWLYSYSTFLFNMVPFEHEYKIMGLAPYCKDRDRIEKCKKEFYSILKFNNSADVFWSYCGSFPTIQSAGKEIRNIFDNYRFDIYSSALQEFTEELIVEMISRAIKKYKVGTIALAGGIFMNVKSNMLIADLPEVNKCFVFPSCGDETNTIGLVYYDYFKKTKLKPNPLNGLYHGDSFKTNEKELRKLDSSKIEISNPNIIEDEVAKLIAGGNIVGRVKGRMEFGARALGNRSIIADPSIDDVLKTINDMIKNRDFWMPFAPSLLAEDIDEYFETNKSVEDYEYMIFTCESKPEKRKYARNALHPYDFTGRPQAVRKEHNPDYHYLISKYKELKGEGLILNTSYNLHGFPIVRTQEQALHVFLESGLNYLALDNFLLRKKN